MFSSQCLRDIRGSAPTSALTLSYTIQALLPNHPFSHVPVHASAPIAFPAPSKSCAVFSSPCSLPKLPHPLPTFATHFSPP
ncbi:hypothetical protein EI94DRAFT_1729971 [Lactarius quietus]|nr:hypothetical protein EI94DRAFT_1729971 [Lactarius quietus]